MSEVFLTGWRETGAMRVERTSAELELRVRCRGIRYQRSLPVSMSVDVAVLRDGEYLATAGTRFGCHAPNPYRRLRVGRADVPTVFAGAPAPTEPLPCSVTGRTRGSDVDCQARATGRTSGESAPACAEALVIRRRW